VFFGCLFRPKEFTMTRKVDRRRFLSTAGTGLAASVAASAGVAALAAEAAPPALPLPDADTAKPAPGTGQPTVCCAPAAKPIYPCSGAADVGEIADHAARKLTADSAGKMSCLAGIGGRIPNLLEIARKAEVILAIDGCPMHCARNTLEKAGFTKFEHMCLADLGMAKGKTPATAEAVAKVAAEGKKRLDRGA
jgi:uncharacterized metal-binding protein